MIQKSRLSFRPRPLDIHKKLPILKNLKDFEDDETPTSIRTHFLRLAIEPDIEVQPQIPTKKVASKIPTPEFVIVRTYERDYSRTFNQPNSYPRARGARAEIGEFVEYDLDNEDEDWLRDFNRDKRHLKLKSMLESILFKLEAVDHKARERSGLITPTHGSPIPVLLTFDAAVEALQALSINFGVLRSIYSYWKEKRERLQKPIVRSLQPPPPVNDTNPYNVFRPREKAHRLHTRRMQRRENNVQSFEKLHQVRGNLDQAKILLEALIKREEKKREVTESEVSLQRLQLKYKNEPEFLEDSLAMPGFLTFSSKFVLSDDEFLDSDDVSNSLPQSRPSMLQTPFTDSQPVMAFSGGLTHHEFRRHVPHGWLHKLDPHEPILPFTKPLEPEKLAAAGIIPPPDSLVFNGASSNSLDLRGRIGRGGRIIFDRCNPLMHYPVDCGDSLYLPLKPQQITLHN